MYLSNRTKIIFILFFTVTCLFSDAIDKTMIAKKLNLINKINLIKDIFDLKTGIIYYTNKEYLVHIYKIAGIYSGEIKVSKKSLFNDEGNFIITYKTSGYYKPIEGTFDPNLSQVLQDLDTIIDKDQDYIITLNDIKKLSTTTYAMFAP